MLAPWKNSDETPRQHIKKQRHYFADKGPYSQSKESDMTKQLNNNSASFGEEWCQQRQAFPVPLHSRSSVMVYFSEVLELLLWKPVLLKAPLVWRWPPKSVFCICSQSIAERGQNYFMVSSRFPTPIPKSACLLLSTLVGKSPLRSLGPCFWVPLFMDRC